MNKTTDADGLQLRWDKSKETAALAAAFAGKVIGAEASYISHGEIQTGLSPDGKRWDDNLPALYAEDFQDLGDERDLLVARSGTGEIVGMAVVAWEHSSRRSFAVLEDMAVHPDHRSMRIGQHLLESVEHKVNERGIEWLFLESGLRNDRAHNFFHQHGFETVSHVFAKKIPT